MEGLTIGNAEHFISTGDTLSEIRSQRQKSTGLEIPSSSGPSFAESLKSAVHQVNELQRVSDSKMEALATGENKNIPEVMLAVEKADIALKMLVQVRNKVIDAYQEVMRMQV